MRVQNHNFFRCRFIVVLRLASDDLQVLSGNFLPFLISELVVWLTVNFWPILLKK